MAIICPTVTAESTQEYQEQLARLEPFAGRIHLDFMDGLFTKNTSISLEQATLPNNTAIQVDLHLMYMRPDLYYDQILRLKPDLVILQAEAQGDFIFLAEKLHGANIKVGIALLQSTPVKRIAPAVGYIDHVLIFSGNLGHFGGEADMSLLSKVGEVKSLKPSIEIAWDGGINDQNARQLVDGGVDVLNVGGYIQNSSDPKVAYDFLSSRIRP